MQRHAESSAIAPAKKERALVHHMTKVVLPKLTRSETGVFVLNGNGASTAYILNNQVHHYQDAGMYFTAAGSHLSPPDDNALSARAVVR